MYDSINRTYVHLRPIEEANYSRLRFMETVPADIYTFLTYRNPERRTKAFTSVKM